MELIDIKFLYDSGQYTKAIQTGDTFLVGRPNSQRGDKYSVLAIDQADLVSYFVAQVPVSSGGVTVVGGTFSLAADGLSATGGVLSNPGTNPVLTITTTSKVKLAHFNVRGSGFGSYGKDDGVVADSINTNANGTQNDLSNSINAGASGKVGNGWTGKITQKTATSIAISFVQVGAGDNITGSYHIEM